MKKTLNLFPIILLINILLLAVNCQCQNNNFSEKRIDLFCKGIKTLPDSILTMKNVVSIDLSGNTQIDLFDVFTKLSQVKTLRFLKIEQCELDSLPYEICLLTNIDTLNLSYNNVKELPNCFSYLSKLKDLDLSYNKLCGNSIELVFSLSKLEILDLAGNNIDSLSVNISKLENIKELYIFDNNITVLPKELVLCKKLRFLNISNNNISVFPDFFYEFNQSIIIELIGNKISFGYDKEKRKNCSKLGLIMDDY